MSLYRAHRFSSPSPQTGEFINPYLDTPRNPLTTPGPTHELCGEWFLEHHGRNFRNSTIFATGDIAQARKYLTPEHDLLEVWPIGDYHICYSPRVRDLFDHLWSGSFRGDLFSRVDLYAELSGAGYLSQVNNGLTEAAQTRCEVMIFAQRYGYRICP